MNAAGRRAMRGKPAIAPIRRQNRRRNYATPGRLFPRTRYWICAPFLRQPGKSASKPFAG